MTYTQILYFTTTVKYNSITKASNALFVSQPAISFAIKSLEQEFQTTLFIRNNNQLTLTQSGEHFYQLVMPLLDLFSQIEHNFKQYINENNQLRIGIPPMIGTIIFPKIFNEYHKHHEKIKLSTIESGSNTLIKLVNNNDIDLAIISKPIEDGKNLQTQIIKETELYYYIRKDHPLAKKKIISYQYIKDEPLILMNDDTYQYELINQIFKSHNDKPNIIFNSNQLLTIKELLLSNNAGSFMFKEIVDNDLVAIPFKEPLKVNIYLLWNKKNNSLLIKQFIDSTTLIKQKW